MLQDVLALVVVLLISWAWVFDGGVPKIRGIQKNPGSIMIAPELQKQFDTGDSLWVQANVAPIDGTESKFNVTFADGKKACELDRSCSGFARLTFKNVGDKAWPAGELRVSHHEYFDTNNMFCRGNGTYINLDKDIPFNESVQEIVRVPFKEKALADNYIFFEICSARQRRVRLLDSPMAEFKIQVGHGRCSARELEGSFACSWIASIRRVSLWSFYISLLILLSSVMELRQLACVLPVFLVFLTQAMRQFSINWRVVKAFVPLRADPMRDILVGLALCGVMAFVMHQWILLKNMEDKLKGFLRLFGFVQDQRKFGSESFRIMLGAMFGCFLSHSVRLVCNEAALVFFCAGYPSNSITLASALKRDYQESQFFPTSVSAIFASMSIVLALGLLSANMPQSKDPSSDAEEAKALEDNFRSWVKPLAYLRWIQFVVFVSIYPKTCGQEVMDFCSGTQLVVTVWRLFGKYSFSTPVRLAVVLILCLLCGWPFWVWQALQGNADDKNEKKKTYANQDAAGAAVPRGDQDVQNKKCAEGPLADMYSPWTWSWNWLACAQDLPRLDQPLRVFFFFAWWSEWTLPVLLGFSYFVAMSNLKGRYLELVGRLKSGKKELPSKDDLKQFIKDQQKLKGDSEKRSLEFQNVWIFLALLLVSSLVFDALRMFGILSQTATTVSQTYRNFKLFGVWSSRLAFVFALYFRSTQPATQYTNMAMGLKKKGWEFYGRVRGGIEPQRNDDAQRTLSEEDAKFLARYLEQVSLKVLHFKQSTGGIAMDNKFQQNIIRIFAVTFLTKIVTELKDFEKLWVQILGAG